jgi:hypothetical protein
MLQDARDGGLSRPIDPDERSMRQFSIQLHPRRSPQFDLGALWTECGQLAAAHPAIAHFAWDIGLRMRIIST